MAVMALSSVKRGPPNAPACWPVRTATVFGSASLRAACARAGGAPRRCCWADEQIGDGCARSRQRRACARWLSVQALSASRDRRRRAARSWRSRRRSRRPAAGSSQSGARRSRCGSSRRRTSFPLTPPRTLSEPCKSCQDDPTLPSTHFVRLEGSAVQRQTVRKSCIRCEKRVTFCRLRPFRGAP